jgi:chlorophyllide a reductase subunit Z
LARVDGQAPSPWDLDAQELLDEYVQTEPVLVQISAAKRLRDRAERDAKRAGEDRVTAARVLASREAMRQGEPA